MTSQRTSTNDSSSCSAHKYHAPEEGSPVSTQALSSSILVVLASHGLIVLGPTLMLDKLALFGVERELGVAPTTPHVIGLSIAESLGQILSSTFQTTYVHIRVH